LLELGVGNSAAVSGGGSGHVVGRALEDAGPVLRRGLVELALDLPAAAAFAVIGEGLRAPIPMAVLGAVISWCIRQAHRRLRG
jgi:hypothetical protein